MKCPACSNEMIKAQATDYGAAYDYCRTCKKEHAEITRDLSKPIQFAADERIVGYDKGYRTGNGGFDGSKFLCLGGCGTTVDPAMKYCKPTCGMTSGQTMGRMTSSGSNLQTLPRDLDHRFYVTTFGACDKLYSGCGCAGCDAAKETSQRTMAYAATQDLYLARCDRKAFPCRSEIIRWQNRFTPKSVHYYNSTDDACQCGAIPKTMGARILNAAMVNAPPAVKAAHAFFSPTLHKNAVSPGGQGRIYVTDVFDDDGGKQPPPDTY